MRNLLTLAAFIGAFTTGANATTQAAFDQVVVKAEQARKLAASVGGEWREVGNMLKQAKAAAAQGDFAKAIALAKEAQFQSEMGHKQMLDQR